MGWGSPSPQWVVSILPPSPYELRFGHAAHWGGDRAGSQALCSGLGTIQGSGVAGGGEQEAAGPSPGAPGESEGLRIGSEGHREGQGAVGQE